jgi:ATP-binding cassette subfamily B protein
MTIMLTMAAQSVLDRTLTLGDLAMVNAYLLQLFIPLNFLGVIYREIRRALTDLENMLALLEVQPTLQDSPDAKPLVISGGKIEFRDVSFAYQPNRSVLTNLSFSINPGTKVAVVGASGSGKTTLSRLLYRFYDVQQGGIYIDGQDIRDCTLASVRQAIAVVPQDTVLFNTTIRDNVAYGQLQSSSEAIDRALTMAQLDGFIAQLPEGDQTVVGERGLKVSGGEKQRISLARAILKRAPILIFDEATSALDSTAESLINQAIKKLTPDHTTLVIAHRLSTITDADQILVMDQGCIVEQGTHQQLLAKGAFYATLWQAQLEHNQSANENLDLPKAGS